MPIAMSKDEWGRIKQWTKLDREDPEVVRRREYVKYLDNTSREMTKSWPNSLENVNKRNEELRQARIQVAEQANTKFYKRYLKRKKEEQERLMYSARDVVFKNKDAPKLLLSAVIETAVQKERIEQIKFINERRKEAAERKKKDDDEIVRKAKEWHELNELRKKRRFEVNKKHQRDILEQAREVNERNRIEHETELNLQKMDILKANEEIAAIKEFEEEFKAEEKARIFNDMERAREETRARKQEKEARDKMDNRLIDVLLKSRAKIEQKRKKTEIDLKNEKLRVLETISQRLESGDAAREAKEQAIFEKAVKEKLEAEDARREARRQKEEGFRRDKIESREQFLRDEQRRLHEFHTTRHWEIMNRFKNVEIFENYLEQQRQERERKIKEYREDILRLWKEREDREARERAESRYFYGELAEKKLRDADNKLLTHAANLLQEAADNERPQYALQRAIDAYCKLYRLYPMPELPRSLAEHFRAYAPRDGSRPDPGYREPAAPPPPRAPVTPVTPVSPAAHSPDTPPKPEPGRKDGLQALTHSSPTKQKKERVEEYIADYKRAGPANGLQRRNEENTFSLPPISVVTCTPETCRRGLKMGLK